MSENEIKIGRIVLGVCATNTYFIYREDTREAVIVDPADNGGEIYDKVVSLGIEPKAIILTHGHFDHIWGIEGIKAKTDIPVYAAEAELDTLTDTETNLSAVYGRPTKITPDKLLRDEEKFTLCGIEFKMLLTPGHTQGGCSYYVEEAGLVFSGDSLFQCSVGRTDFPGGSMSTLVRSVNDKLMTLPDRTRVYPGHGETTTVWYEKQNNPFL